MNDEDQTPEDAAGVCFAHGVSGVRAHARRGGAQAPQPLWTPHSWWEPRRQAGATVTAAGANSGKKEDFFPAVLCSRSLDACGCCLLPALGGPGPRRPAAQPLTDLSWAPVGHGGLCLPNRSLDVFSL